MPDENSRRLGERDSFDTRSAVAGKGKRNRRKRTAQASTLRRINAVARERQATWVETSAVWVATGQPLPTEGLTQDLEHLYDDLRQQRAGS